MAKFSFMLKVLSAEQMRIVDERTTAEYGIPSLLLMENAAHSVVRAIEEKIGAVSAKRFIILCGRGNNGGDGATVARLLWMRGADVKVFLFGKIEQTKGDAQVNFKILQKLSGLKMYEFQQSLEFHEAVDQWQNLIDFNEADVIVDALFGTGLSRPVEGELADLISALSNWKLEEGRTRLIVSVDLPSGLDADKSFPIGVCPKADLTVTFTAPKLANVFPPASNFCGELRIANIGSPSDLIQSAESKIFLAEKHDAIKWLEATQVRSDSYKKTRGRALIIAGSEDYTGAAVLAANACFMAGAGMVTLAVPEAVRYAVAPRLLSEVILKSIEDESVFENNFDCVAIGCGLSSGEKTKSLVRKVVEKRKTAAVVDAEALNALSPFNLELDDEFPMILTPHIGEFTRLAGKEITDRITDASEFAQKHNVILLLKGERSLIARPDGVVIINPTGDSGVSRAGAGDTLTGILTAFLAQASAIRKLDTDWAFESVLAGLYTAGRAAEIAAQKFSRRLMTATQVVACLKDAIEELTNYERFD